MPGTYCEIDLDKEKRDAFVYAIKNHYWYQMYIDDLPIWGKYSLLQTRTSYNQCGEVPVFQIMVEMFFYSLPQNSL